MIATLNADRAALVTGGTGLIGGEVIATMLARGWRVAALVRGKSPQHARSRMIRRLRMSPMAPTVDRENLMVVPGDTTVAFPDLPSPWQRTIAAIVHCAADTSFRENGQARSINLRSAENLLRFVQRFHRPVRTLLVSSASVCMAPRNSEIREDEPFAGFCNEYTQSKRSIEHLVREASDDATIVRPSIVLSRGVRSARFARSILWCVPVMNELVEIPTNADARIDFVPVDWVADAIERLAAAARVMDPCYHLSAGRAGAVTVSEIQEKCSTAVPWIAGIRFTGHGDASEDDRKWRDERERDLAKALSYYLPFISSSVTYSNRRIVRQLGPELRPPPKATDYLTSLLRQFDHMAAIAECASP